MTFTTYTYRFGSGFGSSATRNLEIANLFILFRRLQIEMPCKYTGESLKRWHVLFELSPSAHSISLRSFASHSTPFSFIQTATPWCQALNHSFPHFVRTFRKLPCSEASVVCAGKMVRKITISSNADDDDSAASIDVDVLVVVVVVRFNDLCMHKRKLCHLSSSVCGGFVRSTTSILQMRFRFHNI